MTADFAARVLVATGWIAMACGSCGGTGAQFDAGVVDALADSSVVDALPMPDAFSCGTPGAAISYRSARR